MYNSFDERKILTYELREKNSVGAYYEVTKSLADKLQKEMEKLDRHIVSFQYYISEQNVEPVREKEEYEIELLYLAVIHRWIQSVSGKTGYRLSEITFDELQESFVWMEKSGEFKEEVYRSPHWLGYFQGNDDEKWTDLWEKIDCITEMVDKFGKQYLEKYLPKVDDFLDTRAHVWKEREDAGLILRDKSCYYINMIGAQILNKCYDEDFRKCEKKYIFLPGCVAERQGQCQAIEKKDGYVCQFCSSGCQVNLLSKKYSDVRIIYHGSQIEQKKVEQNGNIGVVGVACVLNLLAGGLKARRLGYVPKCVILNECGCDIHWDEQGVVTSLDEEELEYVLKG